MRIKHHFSLLVLILLAGLAAGVLVSSVSAEGDGPRIIQISPNGQGRAYAVAYSPDGQRLAVGSSLGISFFNSSDLQPIYFTPTDTWVRALAFSPDGSMLASGSYDSIVRLWRASDGTLFKELSGHTAWVRDLAFSPNGDLLATASDDDTVRLWNIPTGNLLQAFDKGTEGARALAFSPDGTILATGGYDKIIRLWNVSDGTLLRELKGHTGWVRTLSFSPNGEYLASGGFDATARLWRVSDGMLLYTLEGHSASVLRLAFSPDGRTLASASVDTTIRLWQIPDGTLIQTLKGHKDFVFSVAFSPDGLTLTSGGADNAVYLWSPLDRTQSPDTKEATGDSDHAPSSTCKACHHPIGGQPARVIETECTACHLNGPLGLNWCPAFYRAPGPTTMSVNPVGILDQSGVPHGNRDFGVAISSPGNGEHLYSRGDIVAAIPVRGKVYAASGDLTDVQVQLQIQSQGKQIVMLTTIPGTDGSFNFYVNLSETEHEMDLITSYRALFPNEISCLRCHDKYFVANTRLSPGQYKLLITATLADGSQAFDDRWVIVDHGQLISLQVKIELEETNRAVPKLPISASARLYEWRTRHFSASSDQKGNAIVRVETLSYAPAHYMFQVEPVVVDEVLYESVEPVEVTLPPGAASAPIITLRIRATTGQLSGRLTPPPAKAVGVSAIHLPDGAVFQTESSPQGTFAFPELPIGRYLLVGDQEVLAAQGLVSKSQTVDLSQTPSPSVDLSLSPLSGISLEGTVHQVGGDSIPFAYIAADKDEITQAVSPDSGRFTLTDLPPKAFTLTVSAPGFYSQAHGVDAGESKPIDLTLVMRPDTRSLPWGSGKVALPAETRFTEDGLHLTLDQGWLWGRGGGGDEPLQISLNGAGIEIGSGSFAAEQITGGAAWFYLFEGQAKLQVKADSQSVVVSEGQMVVFAERFQPVPVAYDPVVVAALHHSGELPLVPAWQPSLQAQIRDRLAQAGISTAQIVTLVTYLMAFLILLVMPVLAVNRFLKNKRERKT